MQTVHQHKKVVVGVAHKKKKLRIDKHNYLRGKFTVQLNIHDESFLQKYSTAKSH